MDYLSWDVIAKVAAVTFGVVVLAAALATDAGRRGLAAVGLRLAWLALRIAEASADRAIDVERADRAARARRELGR